MAAYAPTLASRVVRGIVLWLFAWRCWKLEGEKPAARRCVIVGAPHTSNWDFVFFLGATHHFGILPRFMGKASLFRWPLRRFMFDMGGVPVFWHIANAAQVPIVLAWVCNKTMRGGLGPAIMPSGDYAADMEQIAAFYRGIMPGHPKWAAFDAAD